MRIETLQTLEAVVRTGSFSAAAAARNLTPSAVSLQMKQLEGWLGQVLFDRSGRGTRATPFARRLVADVGGFLAHLDSLKRRRPVDVAGQLRVGLIASFEKSHFPRVLRVLRDRYPALVVRVSLGVSAELIDGVDSGRLDAAVVVRPGRARPTRLVWHDLVTETFVMIAPADAPEGTPRELLRQWPWVRYDASLTGGRLAADFVRRLLPGCRPSYELTSTDSVLAMVAEGLGVSVVPRPRAPLASAYPVRVVELGARAPKRVIAMVARRSDAEERRLQAFIDALGIACAGSAAGGP